MYFDSSDSATPAMDRVQYVIQEATDQFSANFNNISEEYSIASWVNILKRVPEDEMTMSDNKFGNAVYNYKKYFEVLTDAYQNFRIAKYYVEQERLERENTKQEKLQEQTQPVIVKNSNYTSFESPIYDEDGEIVDSLNRIIVTLLRTDQVIEYAFGNLNSSDQKEVEKCKEILKDSKEILLNLVETLTYKSTQQYLQELIEESTVIAWKSVISTLLKNLEEDYV